ncbi:MAG: 16S rRNA (cytosine(1402)-N(4))-methyltransferase RsmH [Acidobacteria bacterium]|nr:16S rRNA (cytosine(1402)-N(4))-methyltransferase RsmH [Acidobacteriota bacterium]
MTASHEPVLVTDVVTWLAPRPDGWYVDGTLGLGGHTAALLDAGAGHVVGIDRDQDALTIARERLARFGDRVTFVHADYRSLREVLDGLGRPAVDGVLVDLGVSSMQLDEAERGFSFRQDGPLDMRMDRSSGEPLSEWLATGEEETLANVIYQFGEERKSRRVARAIVAARDETPFTRTTQLAAVVRKAVGGGWQRVDPATRTFQALRIWINRELDGLEAFLESGLACLVPGGRMAVIAFHSLEDRVVKHTWRRLAQADDATVEVLTRRPVVPDDEEAGRNPRARSARLRVVEKVA